MLAEKMQYLSIPKEKDTVFIHPEPSKWLTFLAKNRLILKNVSDRLKSRRELQGIARNYTQTMMDWTDVSDVSKDIIATGHQATWHHCGIWAKNLATCKFAEVVDGNRLHIVLDHDICDTALVLPRQKLDGNWIAERFEIESEQKSIPLEFRRPPQKNSIKAFVDTIARECEGKFCNDIWPGCLGSGVDKIPYFHSIADLITYFQSMLNFELGLNMIYLPISKLSESEAFFDFVISIVLDAFRFTRTYNKAIIKQLRSSQINQRNTVPRLRLDGTKKSIQLPFWLKSPNGERTSLCVSLEKSNKIKIGNDTDAFDKLDSSSQTGKTDQLRNILRRLDYHLRPKAVSLTAFIRLYLADWFVHGAGGRLYEPVTDYVIENYFGMRQLKYGVATCTQTLPQLDSADFYTENISQLRHELHNMKHNPERYIDESVLNQEPIASLLHAKKDKIAQAKNRSAPAGLRRTAWKSLMQINHSLSKYTENASGKVERKILECEKDKVSCKVCNCREYFFGLFSESNLRRLSESLTFTKSE
jgi:hypothetical protein